MLKDVKRTVNLDVDTDRKLSVLARRFEGNRSLTMRDLIRNAEAAMRPDASRAQKKEIPT